MTQDDVRRRRAERARQHERRVRAVRGAKYAAFALAGVMLLAGAAFGVTKLEDSRPKRVHWHQGWLLVVEGEEVAFAHSRFDGMQGSRAHLHLPNHRAIHYEGMLGDYPLSKFFTEILDGSLSAEAIELPEGTSKPGTFTADNETRVRVFHLPAGESEWREDARIIDAYLPVDGDRFLVTYGNYTDEEIASWQSRVPPPPGAREEPDAPRAEDEVSGA